MECCTDVIGVRAASTESQAGGDGCDNSFAESTVKEQQLRSFLEAISEANTL